VIRALLEGDPAGVDGELFRLQPGTTLAYPRVRERVPLSVGTWGPPSAAAAAELTQPAGSRSTAASTWRSRQTSGIARMIGTPSTGHSAW
jgi:5,10-methylenetetrahydromethanopterin reductase